MSGAEVAMNYVNRPVRKFNPGLLQADDEVISQYVVRQREFEIVSDVLRSNIDTPSCQHILVVAPRGRGKTMLLARMAVEIRGNEELAKQLLPVQFMEESQEIYDLASFWLETLFHLAREVAADHPEFARQLTETHNTLSARWREEGLEASARAAVLDAADRLDRRLVLMVENLQSLCKTVDGEFGWQLRGVLQTEPKIMLLASATSRFQDLEDAGGPFFELFRIVHLQPLNTEECHRLWTVVSEQKLNRHEIRPLEILTGGSPRLLVVIAAFTRHRSIRQLMEDLVTLIDDHTEYFRSHLEALPKYERRVYIALIDLWQPSTTGEIAARARLDVRVVSTMLGRLIDRGAVTLDTDGGGRKRLYVCSERLYSIYYKLRRERNEAAVVEALIRFMVNFYSAGEEWRITDQLFRDALESAVIHAGVERVLESEPSLEYPDSCMKRNPIKKLSERIRKSREVYGQVQLHRDISTAIEENDWIRVLEITDEFAALEWPASDPKWESENLWGYLAFMRSNAHIRLGNLDMVVAIGNEVAERVVNTHEIDLLSLSCWVALNKAHAHLKLGNFEAARSECRRIVDRFPIDGTHSFQEEVSSALLWQAKAENELGNFGDAITLLDEALVRYGESESEVVQIQLVRSLVLKAEILTSHHRDHSRSETVCEEVIERFGHIEHPEIREQLTLARMNRALSYGSLGDFDQEIACYDELIPRLDDCEARRKNWPALIALGYKSRRLAELGMAEEALRVCDDYVCGIEVSSEDFSTETQMWMEWHAHGTRALAFMVDGLSEPAMESFRTAYALFMPYHEVSMGEMLRLVSEFIAADASERDLVEVLAGDDRKAEALWPMIVVLRQRMGESVRAPVEVLQVAADLTMRIRDRIAEGVRPGFLLQSEPCLTEDENRQSGGNQKS